MSFFFFLRAAFVHTQPTLKPTTQPAPTNDFCRLINHRNNRVSNVSGIRQFKGESLVFLSTCVSPIIATSLYLWNYPPRLTDEPRPCTSLSVKMSSAHLAAYRLSHQHDLPSLPLFRHRLAKPLRLSVRQVFGETKSRSPYLSRGGILL